MKQKLIARDKECETLRTVMQSDRSEFVIVCGRRRIGKTFLIDYFFDQTYDFTFVGSHRAKTATQLRNFARALMKHSGTKPKPFADWYDAFDALEDYLETLPTDRKKVIFIDEMPWIDTTRSDFVEALENFWNSWGNRREDIVFIASGSATSWMADNLIENQGGLHNRITQRLYLKPFTLKETEAYLKTKGFFWTRFDILRSYMLTGGIPYYLTLFDRKQSLAQNIDRLCFQDGGALRVEFDELYPALFGNVQNYLKVVDLLYKHKSGLTRSDISKGVKFNGKILTRVLKNLVQCNFIDKSSIFGKERTQVYRLVDHYTLFYYKFIANHNDKDSEWWSHNIDDDSVRSWQGRTFELICLQHHLQIKRALGISGIPTSVYTWQGREDKAKELPGGQIDMLIQRSDGVIHICEMKFSKKKFIITQDYEEKLRDRMAALERHIGKELALVHTFVTACGLASNVHSSLVHSEVTIDSLFDS
ncbi:MAG: ATP-binding protein [Bacteroidales bacterium]|nr:ATP-binding protein [Bacteroidales bacterium]